MSRLLDACVPPALLLIGFIIADVLILGQPVNFEGWVQISAGYIIGRLAST